MMTSKGFKAGTITLDEPRSIYYSGQFLSGKILFELNELLTLAAIKVLYFGRATVKWSEYQTEKYSGVKRTREIEYGGHEVYFNYEQCIFGGSGVTSLPPGPQSFSFSYQIPFNAPSSFRGSKGQVLYTVSVIIEYPDGRREEVSTDFDVVAPLDLNAIDCLKNPTILEFEEVSSCNCICDDEVICIKIHIPVSGYCPGQMMQIKIDSQNNSSSEITKIIFQLVRRERYKSQHPASVYIPPEELLDTMVQGPILANTKRSFTCHMRIPDIIAYYLENCSVIDVAYFLKVKIKMSGCKDNAEDESELAIGLVPLRQTLEGAYTHPLAYLLPNAPLPGAPPPGALPPGAPPSDSALVFALQDNNAAPNNRVSYEIGFKLPGPEPYPPGDASGAIPLLNTFPTPTAPPL